MGISGSEIMLGSAGTSDKSPAGKWATALKPPWGDQSALSCFRTSDKGKISFPVIYWAKATG